MVFVLAVVGFVLVGCAHHRRSAFFIHTLSRRASKVTQRRSRNDIDEELQPALMSMSLSFKNRSTVISLGEVGPYQLEWPSPLRCPSPLQQEPFQAYSAVHYRDVSNECQHSNETLSRFDMYHDTHGRRRRGRPEPRNIAPANLSHFFFALYICVSTHHKP
jgi:hypothetical protein